MGSSVYIVTLAPYEVTRKKFRWSPLYKVGPAPKDGYAKVQVTDGADSLEMGEGRRTPIAVQARAVAEDVIRGVEDHGVFITDHEEPTAQELADADKRRRQFYQRLIDEADASWRQFGNRSLISAHAQFAAEFLGVKREWHSDATELVSCPGCATRIPPGVIKCPNCPAVFDWQRAYELLMLTPDQIKVAVDAGKLIIPEKAAPTKGGKAA